MTIDSKSALAALDRLSELPLMLASKVQQEMALADYRSIKSFIEEIDALQKMTIKNISKIKITSPEQFKSHGGKVPVNGYGGK